MSTADLDNLPPGYLEQYRGDQLLYFAAAMIPVQIIVVALRWIARRYSKLRFGTEEILIIVTLLCGIGMSITSILQVKIGGGGYHNLTVEVSDPDKLTIFAKNTVIFIFLYELGSALPRIALLIMFLQIFIRPFERIICYTLIATIACQTIADSITNFVQCEPLSHFWDSTLVGGWCIDQNDYWRWCTFPSVITDVVMLILPLPTIWRIQLAWKDKIGILLTFLFGGFGLAASVLRFTWYMSVDAVGPNTDAAWQCIPECIVGLAEVVLYLIVVCLPSYRSFYLKLRRTNRSKISISRPTKCQYGSASAQYQRHKQPSTTDSENSFSLERADKDKVYIQNDYTVTVEQNNNEKAPTSWYTMATRL